MKQKDELKSSSFLKNFLNTLKKYSGVVLKYQFDLVLLMSIISKWEGVGDDMNHWRVS